MAEVVRRAQGALHRVIDDETVLYLSTTDEVRVLDGIGSVMWSAFEEPTSLTELAASLAEQFGMPVDQIRTDIEPLITQLLDEGFLVQLDD